MSDSSRVSARGSVSPPGGASTRGSAQPNTRQPPPAPPLIAPTGSPTLDCMADAINSAVAPFQNAPPPEQGAAGWVAAGLGGVLGVIGAPQQLIDNAFAGLTAPIAALFPAMPAITLLGMHIGMMHTHTHPPSLVPPAPPIPLPSIGMLVGSGAMAVLGGGLPLARAGDIGISVTCGSLAPPFEVFTGSSNVFVGGARAARILDITKHCDPTAMGPFGIAMGVAGVAAGAAGAIATNAAAQAAQAAADAAVLALKLLCGKDPGLPPGVGALIGPPLPNVLIGGFPCPPIGDMVIGALMKGLKKLAAAAKKMRSSRRANANCADGSHPIYLVTGENFDTFTDFVSHGLFAWKRRYTTAHAHIDGPLGFGFRHHYQRHLDLRLHEATFIDWDGVELEFPKFGASDELREHGYVLRRVASGRDGALARYELSTRGEPTMEFAGDRFTEVLPLVAMRSETHELRFEYDREGRLVLVHEVELALRTVTRYQLHYDGGGRITGIHELGSKSVPRFACTYTRAGELHQARDACNGLWTYAYDDAHRWTTQTDPRDYSYSFRYDEQGRCVAASGQDGLWAAEVEYAPDEGLTRFCEGGGVWEYHYDPLGFITKIVNPQAGERVRVRSPDGRVLEEIDPGGRRLVYAYDADGALVGRRDRFGYTHPPEHLSPRLADVFTRKLPTTPLAWLFAGRIEAKPEAALGTTGRLLEIPAQLRPLAHSVFRLRTLGGPSQPPSPARWFDALGRKVYEQDGLGHGQRYDYDAAGNLTTYVDRDGQVHRQVTSSWNLLGGRIDPLGGETRYRYSALEQMTELRDPLGNTESWTYDPGQRLVETRRNGELRDSYEWDTGDRLVAKYAGDGSLLFRHTRFHANAFVSRRELAEGGSHEFDYDAHGRITAASTDVHDVRMFFGPRGQRRWDLRDGEGVERLGDASRERVWVLDRFSWSIDPDGLDQLEITAPNGEVTRLHHEPGGIVLRSCGSGTREWLQFDHEGRLEGRLSARHNAEGGHVGWGVRYTYSAEGDLLAVMDSTRGTTSYEVDASHRLVSETAGRGETLRYEFDAADNLVAKPGLSRLQVGASNRAEASASEVFEYDARDRVVVRREREGQVTRLRWDSFDVLVGVERASHGADPGLSWTAGYDAIGRRLWTESEAGRREFYWDGDRLAAEIDPKGQLRIYVYAGADALVPLSFVDYPDRAAEPDVGRSYHVFCDPSGMPLHIEDEGREIVWWLGRVEPWGAIEVHPSATLEYNLRWPGHYHDPELGLHYNRHRYYDPSLGRYLSPDPIGYRGSEVNLYAYCPNPLVQVDILGLHRRPGAEGGDHDSSADNSNTNRPPRPPGGDADPPGGQGYPPRTADAQAQCQHVVDTLNPMTGKGRASVVSVFTHEDGTVSVGLSGRDSTANTRLASDLQGRLNEGHARQVRADARANNEPVPRMEDVPGRYRVATETMPVDNVAEIPGGNRPGDCGEPHSAQAAHGHDSPVNGMDTRWRGKGDNPHPYSGQNADGAPVGPSQMDPCNTCGNPNNIDTYMNHANS